MRKLASIQVIKAVSRIEGADRIELCHVLGWQCVAKKGQFKTGDLCVYFEIDSFLPIAEDFEFLRNTSYKKTDLMGEGFRLKTQTFRGQISQGLVLPTSIIEGKTDIPELCVGMDVTDILGVRKYEAQEMSTSAGDAIGCLPAFVPHTDETRIQAIPELLDEFKNVPYYITTKIDGTSCSVAYDVFEGFHVTGHSVELIPNGRCGFYNTIIVPNDLENKLTNYCKANHINRIVIQGEYVGPGIQKNRLQLKDYEWFVFDIRINDSRVNFDSLIAIANELGLTTVPVEESGDDLTAVYPTVDSLLARAEGNYPCGSRKEGIVIRPTIPRFCSFLNTDLSVKVINNKYLLKNDD